MKRLTGTDALFLSLETPSWHQHVGGLTILDPEGRGITYDDLCDKLEERLPLAPKFLWKLRQVPLGMDRPGWVDDPDFDVRRHVKRIAVPSPGGARETAEVAGMLLSMQLDRRWPLWELWFMEGLAHGRVAMLMKYHHCLLDGIAGASLATVLMDLEPDPPPTELPADVNSSAGSEPHDLQLFAEGLGTLFSIPGRLAKFSWGMAGKGLTMASRFRRDPETRAILRAPATPFNGSIGPRRGLAFSSVSIEDVRKVKEEHGVKVNDIVLALVAGAFRSYLLGQGDLPEAPLVAACPVSTRAEGNTAMDNQISSMLVSLATDEEDPVERLLAINRSSQSAKEMAQAVRAREIQSIGEVAAPVILSGAIRTVYATQVMSRIPLRVNTVVSNVPGPPFPIYACGARIMGIYPSSIILEGMGINATVFSYLDRVDFGFHVDPDLVPDPWAIADAVPDALAELLKESNLGELTPVQDPFGGVE